MLNKALEDYLCENFGDQYRGELTLETTMEDIPEWDSMSFIGLIVGLETRFGVSIGPHEAVEMTKVGAIQAFLESADAVVSG